MKAATVALRDQICAVLSADGLIPGTHFTLSTDQIAQQMAPITMTGRCHRNCDGAAHNPYVQNLVCDGTTHTWQRRQWGTDVYRHLRAMETKGLVARVHVEYARSVYWRWTGPSVAHVDDLEAAWSQS